MEEAQGAGYRPDFPQIAEAFQRGQEDYDQWKNQYYGGHRCFVPGQSCLHGETADRVRTGRYTKSSI